MFKLDGVKEGSVGTTPEHAYYPGTWLALDPLHIPVILVILFEESQNPCDGIEKAEV